MRVGYKLYREVARLAPQDWTSGELVVALMIADSANDGTRRAWISNAELCQLARMGERGVRKALAKLAERGFEFRSVKGVDKHGKEIFAMSGKGVEYQVPDVFMLLSRGAAVAYGLVDNLAAGGLSTGSRRNCGSA